MAKLILLWGRVGLLGSSVELFLAEQEGWKVLPLPSDDDPSVLLQAVDRLNPDAVVIQAEGGANESNLPAMLLKGHPVLKVITLNPNDNVMEVYSKENILIRSASDLISVIEAPLADSSQSENLH